MQMVPVNLSELAELHVEKSVLNLRVDIAFKLVELMRHTGVFHSVDGNLPPVERCVSKGEKRAYNASLELLAQFINGEITIGGQVDDEDLPGPDLAVKYPPVTDPPGSGAFPAPDIVSVGDLVTNR